MDVVSCWYCFRSLFVFCFSEAFILHSVRGYVDSILGVCWVVRCEVKEAEIQAPLLSRQLNQVN